MAKKQKKTLARSTAPKGKAKAIPESALFDHVELKFVRLLEVTARLEIRGGKVPDQASINTDIMAGPASDGSALNVDVTVSVDGRSGEETDGLTESKLAVSVHYQCGFKVIDADMDQIRPHSEALGRQAMLIMWPHLREMVQSTTSKMSIPPVVLPMLLRSAGSKGKAKNLRINF